MTDSTVPPAGQPDRAPLPPSPCVGICALKGDYCYGCGRTSDEIAAWATLSAIEQSGIWAALPGRLAAFGFKTFRLAAGPAVVAEFLGRTFRETTGRWRIVSPSIEGGLTIDDQSRPELVETADDVTATIPNGDWMRLFKHDKVRIFGFASGDSSNSMDTVALVLPKGRAQRDVQAGRNVVPNGYFEVSAPDPFSEVLVKQVGAHKYATGISGAAWQEARAQLSSMLAAEYVRVAFRNAIGSFESAAIQFADPIPAPDANAPADLNISRAFVACAIFHADDPEWLAAALAP